MFRRFIILATFTAASLATLGEAKAEFLFGFTGGSPNFLEVQTSTGLVILSTEDNPITPSVHNQGWWSSTDDNFNGNDNFIVGELPGSPPSTFRNFFTFDIAPLFSEGTITSIVLRIENNGTNDTAGTTYSVFDVDTDAVVLNTKDNNPNAPIFDDLGSGTLYGTLAVGPADGPTFLITLNNDAIADLSAAVAAREEYFSVGGTIPQPEAVPEPASLTLAGFAAIGMAFAARRRRRVASA